jgi:hypothetical protein
MKIAKMITATDVAGNCPLGTGVIRVRVSGASRMAIVAPVVAGRQINLLKSTASQNRFVLTNIPTIHVIYKHRSRLMKTLARGLGETRAVSFQLWISLPPVVKQALS